MTAKHANNCTPRVARSVELRVSETRSTTRFSVGFPFFASALSLLHSFSLLSETTQKIERRSNVVSKEVVREVICTLMGGGG